MTIGVFLAVMLAAVMHAGWNAIIKTGLSKQTSMFILTVGQALFGLAVALFFPFPAPEVWPWLFASGLIHMAYQLFLAYAYEQGDLSRVYPIARGTAPMIVLVISLLFLSDSPEGAEVWGILVLGGGIALMAHGVLRNGEPRRLLPFALGAAVATAGYTLADGLGARVSGEPLAYVGWLMLLAALFYTPAIIALKGSVVLRADARAWGFGLVAAAASFGAYAIAVWAMTLAPIALVGALRETSILFAVLIGWWFFGERMDRGKAAAALLIVAGVILTRF
ncbi:EamA family transporter [Pararhodobacter oceanensis]|uniref:Peptide ABC transporter permease n=1 Tax=Pararhodobacter oceanensis TaxID=2172121 RepID=A0A2T8HYJ1_9RHOB|nr:EamA family transporter [Pararhodobacter oceanensis]PVH30469.1 peptide ABC transporter permease [Pararhodobacter oceanensis]